MKKVIGVSFISDLIQSIKNFDYYEEISKSKISRSIGYFIKLMIIYSIITTIGASYSINNEINKISNWVNTEIENLNYSNGVLNINNNEYKNMYNHIIVDTSKENNDEYESKADVVVGKNYCSLKIDGNIFRFKYSNYFYEDINKEDIMNKLSNKNITVNIIMCILIFIFSIIILSFSTMMDILIIALIGYIEAKIISKEKVINFSNIFKIAIHAITLPIILNMIYYCINIFTGFEIKYFSIMYTLIATIYMITAIILIQTDNNRNDNIQ